MLKIAEDKTFGFLVTNPSKIGRVLVCFYEDNIPGFEDLKNILTCIARAFTVVLVNKNNASQMFRFYSIVQTPTLIMFKHGKLVGRINGFPQTSVEVDVMVEGFKPFKKKEQ